MLQSLSISDWLFCAGSENFSPGLKSQLWYMLGLVSAKLKRKKLRNFKNITVGTSKY